MGLVRVVGAALFLFVLTAIGVTAAPSHPSLPLLPPPSFRPALNDWLAVTTGPTRHRFTSNLLRLRPSAALITAITFERGGPTRNYRPSVWPLRLGAFHVSRRWETQPAPNVQERVRDVAVSGWRLDVRVYFATQHPSELLLRVTQTELNRMRLP